MLWHVREGMQGLLAAMRAPGSALIIEDVCVPPERIAEAAQDLQAMLGRTASCRVSRATPRPGTCTSC